MPSFKVFISSVQNEFAVEREALFQYFKVNALLIKFFEPILFEKLPAASQAPNKVYLGEVGESKIYLGIVGKDYGYEDSNGISPTEHEYNRAADLAIQRWIFIKDGTASERHPKEQAFIRKVSQEVSWKRFSNIEDLKQEVFRSCLEYLEDKGLISDKSFDLSPNTDASLADIEPEKINAFVRAARSKRGFPLKEGALPEQVLAHLHMWNGQQLTNSALLVFGKKPQQFFPTAIIKCAHFHGTQVAKPIPDHKVFQGDVFNQVDQAVDFVLSKINVSVGTRDKSVQAPIEYEIPRAAVAEAIVNAVAHRDYHSNGSVQVMLFTDRLEITNPGRLSPELTLSQLRIEHPSYPTNPLLAECMYQAGYIERFGTGTLEIIRLSEEAHLNDPNFTVDGGFKVVLWRPAAKTAQAPDKYRPSTDQVIDHDTDYDTEGKLDKYRTSTGQVPDKYQTVPVEVERLVLILEGEMKSATIQELLGLRHRETFRDNYLLPAVASRYVEMTYPNSPNSPKQKYRLTAGGKALKESLENK